MVDLKELGPSLRWARRYSNIVYNKPMDLSHWVIVLIEGHPPFLSAKIVFDPWKNHDEHRVIGDIGENLFRWEFGPEIKEP